MKLSVEKLKTAWRQVAGVCPSRSPREIYQYVRLAIGEGVFSLHSTDGEVYVAVGDIQPTAAGQIIREAARRMHGR